MNPDQYESCSGITIPLLVSAIGNIFVSLIWVATCFLSFIAVPLIVLCVFEFMLYAKADTLPPLELARRAKKLAIFEIIVGVFNTIALVCGIIVLVNAPKLTRRTRAARRL